TTTKARSTQSRLCRFKKTSPHSENRTSSQRMLDASVPGFGGQVLGQAQDPAAAYPGYPAGASDEQEAQSPHAAHNIGDDALARVAVGNRRVWGWKLRATL